MMMLVILVSQAGAAGHESCGTCHESSHTQSDLILPGDELCAKCHQGHRGAGNHQVGMEVPGESRITLPVPNGRLACITCHDPHKTGMGLRLPEDELCNECHHK